MKNGRKRMPAIAGHNYVKLRDIGKAVGFNVFWDADSGCVQIETGAPYTGKTPSAEAVPSAAAPSDVDAAKQDMRPYGGRCLIYWKGSPPWWSFDPPGSGVLPLPGFHDFGTLCPKVAKAAYREEGYSRPQPTSGLTR